MNILYKSIPMIYPKKAPNTVKKYLMNLLKKYPATSPNTRAIAPITQTYVSDGLEFFENYIKEQNECDK